MRSIIRDELIRELTSKGFSPAGESPNGTLALNQTYLEEVDLADLLETMVARREKIFHSQEVVEAALVTENYNDTVLAIEAIKNVIRRLECEE